jgi:Fe-S-cluster containining protein
MTNVKNYIEEIYQEAGLFEGPARRQDLVREMQELEGKTIHCFTCPGTCCTQAANSMLITPIEALEILTSINIDKFTDSEILEFKKRMKDTVSQFRLDVEIYTGKKTSSAFRKTYTCPFFNNGALGCSLSRGSKPYGCLGFNPKTSEDNGKTCSSNVTLLEVRENTFFKSEDLANEKIRKDLSLSWIKQNIPQALLDVLEKSKTC